MENEKLLKRITKRILKGIISIFIFILIVYAISLSLTYNIWENAHYLLNPDNRKIYAAVCKNIDFMRYKLNSLEISSDENDSYIQVNLKEKFFPVIYIPFIALSNSKPYSDINKMFRMYEELSVYDRSVSISIYDTFADGEFMHEYILSDDKFSIEGYFANEKVCYAIKTVMSHSYVTRLNLLRFAFEDLPEELPENYSIKDMYCSIVPNFDDDIRKLKGLQSLELRGWGYKDDRCFDLGFIDDLPELETLTLHWYADKFEFSDDTKYTNIKKVTLYTDTYTKDNEELFHKAFPNAEIEIICDQ